MDDRDAATQTENMETELTFETSLEVATLANKFLHASYCFLVLGITFSSAGLAGLATTAKKREDGSKKAARSLLAILTTPKLADIHKPNWRAEDGTDGAVRMMIQVLI